MLPKTTPNALASLVSIETLGPVGVIMPVSVIMPPFTAPEAAYGMTLYSMKAILHGQGGDVFEMIRENFPK